MEPQEDDSIVESLREIAREEAAAYPEDTQAAADACVRRIKAMPNRRKVMDEILGQYARNLVFSVRGQMNATIKRHVAYPPGKPKVIQGQSKYLQEISKGVLDLFISGRRVGDIRGEELDSLAEQEETLGKGHLRNAAFYRLLRKSVPDGKTVKESVKPAMASVLWKQAEKLPNMAWG